MTHKCKCGRDSDVRVPVKAYNGHCDPVRDYDYHCYRCYIPAVFIDASQEFFAALDQARAYKRMPGSGDAYETMLALAAYYRPLLAQFAHYAPGNGVDPRDFFRAVKRHERY